MNVTIGAGIAVAAIWGCVALALWRGFPPVAFLIAAVVATYYITRAGMPL